MNLANRVLGHAISAVHAQTEKLELRWHWLLAHELWQEHIDEMGRAIDLSVSEPITQGEYDRRLAAAREEWVAVEEIAAFLAGYRHWLTTTTTRRTEEGSPPVPMRRLLYTTAA